jgi:hypothetical protein
MRSATKLVLTGAGIGVALMLASRRRDRSPSHLGRDTAPADLGITPDGGADAISIPPGISQVDPQPLTQISAEAIDPDATEAAHDTIVEQRERLPVPGKNLP